MLKQGRMTCENGGVDDARLVMVNEYKGIKGVKALIKQALNDRFEL
jgi:hypothetical protein